MTVTLAFRFPFGHFHGTPWGRQVNESAVDWPPSPWRILRGLYATRCTRAPEISEEAMLSILGVLADAPSYRLPRSAEGHTRHYMPDTSHGPVHSTDKTFDPFAAVERDEELLVRWPGELEEPGRSILARLCDLLPYLGRAESICEARLVPEGEYLPSNGWTEPGARDEIVTAPVRILVPLAPLDLSCLLAPTMDVRKQGHVTPPGTRLVPYNVDGGSRLGPATVSRRPAPQSVNCVILRLDGKVLPTANLASVYGGVLRRAALARHRDESETLSGRPNRPGGEVRGSVDSNDYLRDDHRHAHYLVVDADQDRLLDTAIVWAPRGFQDKEVGALLAITGLVTSVRGFRPVRVAATAVGHASSVAPRGYCSDSTTWESVTPFVPYRHQKKCQRVEDFLSEEINRELRIRGFPAATVRRMAPRAAWLSFTRTRTGRRNAGHAFGLQLELERPMTAGHLLALGSLSHFGLGLFRVPTGKATARSSGRSR